MSKEHEITAILKLVGDVSDVQKKVGSIQKVLEKLKLPSTLRASFNKTFTKLEDDLVKFQGQLKNGFNKKSDITGIQNTAKAINQAFDKMVADMAKVQKLDIKEIFDIPPESAKKIKQYTSEIERYQKQIQETSKSLATNVNSFFVKQKDVKKSEAFNTEGAFRTAEIIKEQITLGNLTEAYEEATKAVNKYSTMKDTLKGQGKEFKNVQKNIEVFSNLAVEIEKVIKNTQNFNNDIKKLNTDKAIELATAFEKGTTIIEETKTATEELQQTQQKLGHTIQGVAEEQYDFNRQLDDLKTKAAYFFGLTNSVYLFRQAVTKAYETVKKLDATMTEAAVVTEFSVGDMWDQLPTYAAEASKLGANINDLYGATTLYYQQGLKTNEAMAVGTETMKMARIAGLESVDATNLMTAALRGFNMELNETSAIRVNDVYSKLAAITAADTEEIGTAVSKTASIAASANMEFETTAAFLSQIIETTREAPETAGTALKTIIARFSEVKELAGKGLLTGEDEEGEVIDVNKIQGALRSVGISMTEFFAGTEGLDSVLLKLAEKWDTLDFTTQRYIATTAAGSRQQSRFIAMMSDYGRTVELVEAANNSAGASQEQFDKTLESLEAKTNRLKVAWDQFLMGLSNQDIIKNVIDLLANFLETVNKLLDKTSGGNGIVKTFLSAFSILGTLNLGKKVFGGKGILTQILGDEKSIGTQAGNLIKKGFNSLNFNNFKSIFDINKFKDTFYKDTKDLAFWTEKEKANLESRALTLVTGDSAFDSWKDDFDKALKNNDYSGVENSLKNVQGGAEALQEEVEKIPPKIEKVSTNFGNISKTATTAGMALLGVSAAMQALGASDESVKVVQGLGIALTTLGQSVGAIPEIVKAFEALKGIQNLGSILSIVGIALALFLTIMSNLEQRKELSIEGSLERVRKETEEAKAAAENAQQTYDSLLNSKNEHNQLQNTLNSLVKGTDEWSQALITANQKVLELINTFPILAGYLSQGQNGQLIITDEGWQKATDEQQKLIKNTSRRVYSSQIENSEINTRKAQRDYFRNFETGLSDSSGDFRESPYAAPLYYDAGAANALLEAYDDGRLKEELEKRYAGDEVKQKEMAEAVTNYKNSITSESIASDALKKGLLTSQVSQDVLNTDYSENVIGAFSNRVDKKITAQEIEAGKKDYYRKTYEELAEEYQAITGLDYDQINAKFQGIGKTGKLKEALIEEKLKEENLSKVSSDTEAFSQELSKSKYSSDQASQLAALAAGNYGAFNLNEIDKLDGLKAILEGKDFEQFEFDIDIEEIEKQIKEEFEKATNFLKNKGIEVEGLEGQDIGILKNISNQVVDFSKQDAQKYVDEFTKIINNPALSESQKEYLSNVLSSTDWKDLNAASEVMKQIQSQGIDTSIIENFWRVATDGANAYVQSVENALSSAERMRNTLADLSGMEERFTSGTSTQEDIQSFIDAGVDIEALGFDLTIEGWYATEEAIQAATQQLREYEALQARLELEAHLDTFGEAKTKANSLQNEGFITQDENGQYTTDTIVNSEETADILAQLLGEAEGPQGDETQQEYQNRIQEALYKLIELLNTGEKTAFVLEQQAQMAQAAVYNGNTDAARYDGADEGTVRQTMQQEAQGLGLDVQETTNYADYLHNDKQIAQEIADSIAIDIAKMNSALSELTSKWNEWNEALNSSDEDSMQFQTALEGLRNNLSLLTGISQEASKSFDASFFQKNSALFQKAAQGDLKAVDALRKATAKEILLEADIEGLGEGVEDAKAKVEELIGMDLSNIPIGVDLDSSYIDAFNELIQTGAMTAQEVTALLETIGYEPVVEPVSVPLSSAGSASAQTNLKASGTFFTGSETITANTDMQTDSEILVPKIVSANHKGSATKTGKGGGKKGGGGGKGSAPKDTKTWKNPFDKYYNKTQEIEELTRDRNNLEKEYNLLLNLNETSAERISEIMKEQLDNLRQQVKVQKELAAGKKDQIQDAKNKTYEVKGGKAISFQEAFNNAGGKGDISQYGYYDEVAGQVVIDWDALEALQSQDEEQGKAVEAYIQYLEKIEKELEKAEDALLEIQSQIKEIVDKQIEARVGFIESFSELMAQQKQQRIDDAQELSDTLTDSNSNILDALRESIDLERQIRDNTKKEEEIADKEARLAFLRRDTSGANLLEIKQLEEEISDMKEAYGDTLVDQEIDKLSKASDEATEQRQKQIDIAQAQLDWMIESGVFRKELEMLDESDQTREQLKALWDEMKNYEGLSEAERINLDKEFNELYLAGMSDFAMQGTAMAESLYSGQTYSITDASGQTYEGMRYDSLNDEWTNGSVKIASVDITGASYLNNTLSTDKEVEKIENIEKLVAQRNELVNKILGAIEDYNLGKVGAPKKEEVASWVELLNDKNAVLETEQKENENKLSKLQKDREELIRSYYSSGTDKNKIYSQIEVINLEISRITDELSQASIEKTANLETINAIQNTESQIGSSYGSKVDSVSYGYYKTLVEQGIEKANEYLDEQFKKYYLPDSNTGINNSGGTTTYSRLSESQKASLYKAEKDRQEKEKEKMYAELAAAIRKKAAEEFARKNPAFATGGIADFTGPAWLDGTPSKPELVLNAQDTKNFIQLKDILAEVMGGVSSSNRARQEQNSGDNYFDISIQVDEISSDYDVDRLAERIKQQIHEDSIYRNVNTINWIR